MAITRSMARAASQKKTTSKKTTATVTPKKVTPKVTKKVKKAVIASPKAKKAARAKTKKLKDEESIEDEETEDEQEETPSDGEEEDLAQLRRPKLLELCELYGLQTTGTAEQMRKRLRDRELEEHKTRPAVTPPAGKKKGKKEDTWRNVVMVRLGNAIDLDEYEWSWDEPTLLLTPAVWPALFAADPMPDEELYARRGALAKELEGIVSFWKRSLRIGDKEAMSIVHKFLNIRQAVINSKDTPRMWATKHWARLVCPAMSQLFRLQGQRLAGAGLRAAGSRLEQLADVPWDNLGLDAMAAVRRIKGGSAH